MVSGTLIMLIISSCVVNLTVTGQVQLMIAEALQVTFLTLVQVLSLGVLKSNHQLHRHLQKLSIWQQLLQHAKLFGLGEF